MAIGTVGPLARGPGLPPARPSRPVRDAAEDAREEVPPRQAPATTADDHDEDVATLIRLGRRARLRGFLEPGDTTSTEPIPENTDPSGSTDDASAETEELSPQEQQTVRELAARDREVRAHEQAHIAAGGGLVHGGASFSYVVGPDGKRYAAGGEVQISVSEAQTPEETQAKAQRIRRAALAPANPSGQDRAVAARAAQMAQEAAREAAARSQEEQATEAQTPDTEPASPDDSTFRTTL